MRQRAGADGGSNGHFTFAAGRAGEKQAETLARQSARRKYGAEQDQQSGTEFAGNLLAQRTTLTPPVVRRNRDIRARSWAAWRSFRPAAAQG